MDACTRKKTQNFSIENWTKSGEEFDAKQKYNNRMTVAA